MHLCNAEGSQAIVFTTCILYPCTKKTCSIALLQNMLFPQEKGKYCISTWGSNSLLDCKGQLACVCCGTFSLCSCQDAAQCWLLE